MAKRPEKTDTDSAPEITFIVTALNEEPNIRPAVEKIVQAAEGLFSRYEILLVDDGSTDKTGPIMDEMARANPSFRVVHNERNLGLGGAYKRGIREARGRYVMWIPGDNGERVEGIRGILEKVGQADIVVPYLQDQWRPLIRRITSRGFVFAANMLFGLRLVYYNGLVVHQTALIRKVKIETDSFAYQAEALIKLLKAGCTYVEVPYMSRPEVTANTKALYPKNLLGVVGTLARLAVTRPWRSSDLRQEIERLKVQRPEEPK